jgi:hypothetical protein
MAAIELDASIGHYEADQEVQDLLTASVGLNLGIDFLPGSFGYDGVAYSPEAEEAARILWLDAFVANVDRTWRNPNLLLWHRQLWCIDHGAALYFHHAWDRTSPEGFAAQPYDARNHVLIRHAPGVGRADEALAGQITAGLLGEVVAQVPDEWMEPQPEAQRPEALRAAYVDQLLARVAAPRRWLPAVTP